MVPSARENEPKRRSLMWRIQDIEEELETDDLDELTRAHMTHRIVQLRDQLRRLGGPVEEEVYR